MKKKNDKWGKKQVFIINSDPYKQDTVVVVNGHFRDVIPFLKRQKTKNTEKLIKYILADDGFKVDHEANTGEAETWTTLPTGYVVTCSHQDKWQDTVEVITHECLHLTHYILRKAGIVLCRESEEAYTYLQGHLLSQILNKVY